VTKTFLEDYIKKTLTWEGVSVFFLSGSGGVNLP
jgi:hypothetical protein